jgi:hypothetical protein
MSDSLLFLVSVSADGKEWRTVGESDQYFHAARMARDQKGFGRVIRVDVCEQVMVVFKGGIAVGGTGSGSAGGRTGGVEL